MHHGKKTSEGIIVRNAREWFEEACDTGELFPGRQLVCVKIYIGTTFWKGNGGSCPRKYLCTKSHTPSVFTVRGVCSNPKLLGVSIMTKTEDISTALSVLL